MTTIAFVGVGAMGSRMAVCLAESGHVVTVWNRTEGKAQALVPAGCRLALTAAEAAAASDVVITMVRDPEALSAVSKGLDGVIAGLRPNALLIDMSTVGPDAVHELAARLPHEVDLLDAPVLGSVDEAREGRLRIFVGGDADVFARARQILEVLGEPVLVGPTGSGAAAKLVANSTLFAVLAALGEAIALGAVLGLSREDVLDVLTATPLAAQAERRRAALEADDYPPRFQLALARKDADLLVTAAASRGLGLRLASGARSWLADAEEAGWGGRDYSALLAWLQAQAEAR